MSEPSLVGSQLGKYEVKAEIGRGGMGTVYLGYDPLLDRQLAIKVLAPHLVWNSEFVERFLREARAAARLKHPAIVTVYDVGQEGSWYYFVMEHLAGETLAAHLQQRGALPAPEALAILRPLAAALDYAHQRDIVHRDVKPGNVILGPEGQVTLMDFGIARAAQEGRLTGTGTIVGTPEYMSPEQAKGLGVDARTDQYSLAVVAYQMLSGQVPFQADSTLALMYKVVHEPPPPLAVSRPDLPPALGTTLEKALAKEPGERYPTVTAFVEALEQAPASAAEAVAAPPLKKGKEKSKRKKEAVVAEAAAAPPLNEELNEGPTDEEPTTTITSPLPPAPQPDEAPAAGPQPRRPVRRWLMPVFGLAAILAVLAGWGLSGWRGLSLPGQIVGVAVPGEMATAQSAGQVITQDFSQGAGQIITQDFSQTATPTQLTAEAEARFVTWAAQVNENMATATPAREPTATPTPLPTSEAVAGARVLFRDEFDDSLATIRSWENTEAIVQRDETMQIIGHGDWGGITRYGDLREGQGVAVRFKFTSGTASEIYLQTGEWQTSALRRWGIYIHEDNTFSANVYEGIGGFADVVWTGDLHPVVNNHWYYLTLRLGGSSEFVARIWDPDKPDQYLEMRKPAEPDWDNLLWYTGLASDAGIMEIDSYQELDYSSQAAPPSATAAPAAPADEVHYLSDLDWAYATNGYGPIEKDRSNGEEPGGDGKRITLNGQTYDKGLGVHAVSDIRYNLTGTYSTFIADVGLDDEIDGCEAPGTIVFQVWADGAQVYDSGVMKASTATKHVEVNVAAVNELKLVVADADGSNYCDHADWAGARLIRRTGLASASGCPAWFARPEAGQGVLVVENHLGEELRLDAAYASEGWTLPAKRGDTPGRVLLQLSPGHYEYNDHTTGRKGHITVDIQSGQMLVSPIASNNSFEEPIYPLDVPAGCP